MGDRRLKVGEVARVKHGFAFDGACFVDEPTQDVLVTPGNFEIGGGFKLDKLKYYLGPVPEEYVLSDGDLIVTMTDLSKESDTLGYPAIVPRHGNLRFLHNQRIGKLEVTRPDLVDQGFLHWLLRSPEYRAEVLAGATGTTVKHTAPSRIEAFEFDAPSLSEQRSAAHILGTLDDRIELNRRTNETLLAMARLLHKSWFIDFDPVRAKVSAVEPTGMDQDTAALFPGTFQQGIPDGWQLLPLHGICTSIFSGGTPSTSAAAYWGGQLPWLSSGETRSSFIIETEKTITDEGVAQSSTRLARAGTTVIASAGQGHTRGQTALLTFDSYINQSVVALQADAKRSSDLFLFLDLLRRYEEFRQLSESHSSRGSLTTKLLGSLLVVMPPLELISAFDRIVSPMVERIISALKESRSLGTLRDALLPRLLSGELSVQSAERAAEAIA
jgi:type I restriction enzyme S subunit